MEMRGKVALITGAGGGIGRATGPAFARSGARIAAVDADRARGEETVAQVASLGREAHFFQADVTRADAVKAHAET